MYRKIYSHANSIRVMMMMMMSTCMSVLARRRAIMGSIVQPKRSCLGAAMGTAESPHRWGNNHPTGRGSTPRTHQP